MVNRENVTLITEEKSEFLFVQYDPEKYFDNPFSIDLGYLTFNKDYPTDVRALVTSVFKTGQTLTELKFFIHNCDSPHCAKCPYRLVDNTAPCTECYEGFEMFGTEECSLSTNLVASEYGSKALTAA